MNFLLDTNVVSEWVKPRPDPGVIEWLETADEDRLFLSVATLAEDCRPGTLGRGAPVRGATSVRARTVESAYRGDIILQTI